MAVAIDFKVYQIGPNAPLTLLAQMTAALHLKSSIATTGIEKEKILKVNRSSELETVP